MSTIGFLNIPLHGHVNPTLPVVAELVRRGHRVTYHTSPAFSKEIEATGATVFPYPGGDQPLPDPPMPVTMLDGLAGAAVGLLPAVLSDLRRERPDLIVHGAACPWGAVAARELRVPAASTFTTFAFNRSAPSPTGASLALLAQAAGRPRNVGSYLRSRWTLSRLVDDITDVPPGEFACRRDGAAHDRARATDTYWLVGTGLSQVTMARIGSTPFRSRAMTTRRVMVHIPESVDGGPTARPSSCWCSRQGQRDKLKITCNAPLPPTRRGMAGAHRCRAEPPRRRRRPHRGAGGPSRLGHDGRRSATSRARSSRRAAARIYATVPSLEGHRGETLAVTVIDPSYASPAGQRHDHRRVTVNSL